MTDDDLLDLIGDPAPPPLEDSTPRERAAALRAAVAGNSFVEAGVLMQPVTKNFLGKVFQMHPNTVTARLATCPIIEKRGTRELYDFRTAVSYLVPPKMDVEQYIRSLDAAKLPNHINKMFWEALTQRLKYMIAAGEAWATEDVLSLLGQISMTIKDRLQLWNEAMRERAKLSDDQMAMLSRMVDELQADIWKELVAIPAKRSSLPIAEKPVGGEGVAE